MLLWNPLVVNAVDGSCAADAATVCLLVGGVLGRSAGLLAERRQEMIATDQQKNDNCAKKHIEKECLAVEALLWLNYVDGIIEHRVDELLAILYFIVLWLFINL